MAVTLSRIDRLSRSHDVTARFPSLTVTGVDVALLPPRSTPTAATVWTAATYADGTATVLLAGPDADSAGALVVSASADLWMRVTDAPEVDAEYIERITVLGAGSLAPLPSVHVASVNGRTGAVVLDAEDVGAATPADLSGGLATKVNSSTYTAGLAAKQDVATLGAAVVADATVRAAFGTTTQRGSLAVITDSISSYDQAGIPGKITRNWLGILSINSAQHVRHGGIYGTAGYTLAQIRDTHLPQVLALNPRPEACCIAGGTNDVSDQAAGIAALNDIITSLRGAGIQPLLWLVPPRTDAGQTLVSAWNAKIRGVAAREGLQVVDGYTPLVDPASGGFKSGLVQSGDPVHPSAAGHAAIAAVLVADQDWLGRFGNVPPYLAAAAGDTANLIGDRGLFIGDANGDGVSDGWTTWGTDAWTASRSTDTDGYVWQRMTKPSGNANQGGLQYNFATGYAVGDVLSLAMKVRTNRADMGAVIDLVAMPSFESFARACYFELGGIVADGIAYTAGVVPVGTTSVTVNFQVTTSAPAADAYLEASRVTVLNRTALGADTA